MNFEREKANMLANAMLGFKDYVNISDQANKVYLSHPDKLYRLKLLIEEFKWKIFAEEILRINRFIYDQKTTAILVDHVRKSIHIIGEFIDLNLDDLFIFSARLYTLRMILSSIDES